MKKLPLNIEKAKNRVHDALEESNVSLHDAFAILGMILCSTLIKLVRSDIPLEEQLQGTENMFRDMQDQVAAQLRARNEAIKNA